jgi:hypothetical protein
MFTDKVVVGFEQQKNEKNQYTSVVEEVEIYDHSPQLFIQMLNEGPCQVMFNRVYSKGIRTMRCLKPEFPSSRNAFDPRFPGLISVVDLDKGDWRSFYYEQVFSFRRIRKSNLNYQQRKIAAVMRGEDWDYMYPGPEGDSLRGEDMYENFKSFREEFILKPLLRQKSRMPR